MSRGEFADAINRALDRLYPNHKNRSVLYVDARWVGKLERGEIRWPNEERRAALRDVFGVDTDTDLGLFSARDVPTRHNPSTPTPPPASS